MPTRGINRKSGGPATGDLTGAVSPFGVNSDNDRLYLVTSNRAGGSRKKPISTDHFRAVTASTTINPSDDGTTFSMDSTTSIVLTLPATQAGLKFRFVVTQLTSSGGHAFSPAAADKIMGNGFTAADDKDAICSAATDRVGDFIELTGDGIDGWYITGVVGTFARET